MQHEKWRENDSKLLTVAWFSTGASSAVAIKLAIDSVDRIIYNHISDQHHDSMRFLHDCEKWFGREIEILHAPFDVNTACKKSGFVNGPYGANCTVTLKKKVRAEWEKKHEDFHLRYVWGLDAGEVARVARIEKAMPAQEHVFPLIDRGMTKSAAHKVLKASGVKRPEMYTLGYSNNNCIGCVKGGKGYWNHIRIDFPEVFKARAKMEREVGASCLNGIYLDELHPDCGRHAPPVVGDCGILCELMAI